MLVGQPKILKEVNKNIIKDLIFTNGPITKPELSRITNLSLPTVNKVVDALEQEGTVRQDGMTGSSSGKKAKVYVANENAGNLIILYYLDGKLKGCLANAIGDKIYELSAEVNAASRELSLQSLYQAIDRLMEHSETEIMALGIGVPGVVKNDKRITNITSIPGWTNIKLEEILTNRYHIPVFVENDVKLTTMGYYHEYLEGTCKDMVYLYIGKGIGSGIIINGILHKGFSSFAGETGYLAPFENEKEEDYSQGGGWFEDVMQNFLSENQEGCPVSPRYIHYIAVSMANYIVTLNPEVMVFQGKWLNEKILEEIKKDVKRYIPDESLPDLAVNSNEECGINGLINMCLVNLSARKQLILRGRG